MLSLKKLSGSNPVLSIPHLDKLAHFGMYFIWAVLLVWESRKQYPNWTNRFQIMGVVFLVFCYGSVIELLQSTEWIGRSFEINDIIANITGAAAGSVVCSLLLKSK